MKVKLCLKRTIAYVVMTLLILSFASCAKTENTSTTSKVSEDTEKQTTSTASSTETKNSWEIDKSPIDINIFVDIPGHDYQQTWGKDDVSKKWIADTGVNLKWETTPDSDHKKLNLYIASGSLPDIVALSTGFSERRQLAKKDVIWALNKLAIEASAPNFMNNFDKNIITAKRVDYDSYDFYAMPCYHTPMNALDEPFIAKNLSGIIVIDKIYQEMGSPVLKSGDDYISLLKKVKEKYPSIIAAQSYRMASPDSDGNPWLVAILLQHSGLGTKFFKQNDEYFKYWQHPNFMLVLKFANQLYNEGLVDKTEFTDDKTRLLSKVYSGTIFSELNEDADNIDKYNVELHKVKPDSNWIMIEPFTLDPNVKYEGDSIHGGVGEVEVIISKNSKKAIRSLRFLDYICQPETQKILTYGIEGRGHIMVNGRPVLTKEYLEDEKKVGRNNSLYGNFDYYVLRNNYWNPMAKYDLASDIQKSAMQIANKYYKDFSFYVGADVYEANSEEAKIYAQIKQYYRNEIMKIITGNPSDVQTEYDNMIAEMKKMGLDILNKHYTEYFNNKQQMIDKYSK